MIQSTFNMFSYRTQQNHTDLIILINVLSTHCWQGYTRAQRRKIADNTALDQPLLTQRRYSPLAASPLPTPSSSTQGYGGKKALRSIPEHPITSVLTVH